MAYEHLVDEKTFQDAEFRKEITNRNCMLLCIEDQEQLDRHLYDFDIHSYPMI